MVKNVVFSEIALCKSWVQFMEKPEYIYIYIYIFAYNEFHVILHKLCVLSCELHELVNEIHVICLDKMTADRTAGCVDPAP